MISKTQTKATCPTIRDPRLRSGWEPPADFDIVVSFVFENLQAGANPNSKLVANVMIALNASTERSTRISCNLGKS